LRSARAARPLRVESFIVSPLDIDEFAEPGPALAEPLGSVVPAPRGRAGWPVGSFAVVLELIEPVDEPAAPEFVEPDVPERIESEDGLERAEPFVPFEWPLVEPDRSAEFIVVEPPASPIGRV
jgi:hypothetical protein